MPGGTAGHEDPYGKEEKPVIRVMTQRALRRAAKLHPDQVRYEKKKGVSRPIRVEQAL